MMKTLGPPRRALLAALTAAVIGATGCAATDPAAPAGAAAGSAPYGPSTGGAAVTPGAASRSGSAARPATASGASGTSGAAGSSAAVTTAPTPTPPAAKTSVPPSQQTSPPASTPRPAPIPALTKEQARGAAAEASRLLTAGAPGLAGSGWIPCRGHDAPYRSGAELLVRDPKGGPTQRGLIAGYRDCYYFENPQNEAVLTLSILEYADTASAKTAVASLAEQRQQRLTGVQPFAIGTSRSFGGTAKEFEVDPRYYLSTISRQGRVVLALDHSTSIADSPDGGAGGPTVRVLAGLQQRVSSALAGFRPTPPDSLSTLNPDPTGLAQHTIPAGPGGPRYAGGKLGAFPAAAAPALTIDDATGPEELKLIHKAEVDTFALGGARVYRTVHPAAAGSMREGLYRLVYEQKSIAGQRIAVKSPAKNTVCFAATSTSIDPTDIPVTTYACAGNVGRYAFLFTATAPVAPEPDVDKMVVGPVRKQVELLSSLG